jgi:hypothetical protein
VSRYWGYDVPQAETTEAFNGWLQAVASHQLGTVEAVLCACKDCNLFDAKIVAFRNLTNNNVILFRNYISFFIASITVLFGYFGV